MSFTQDLKVGEEAEKEFGAFLEAHGWNYGFNTCKTITEKRFYDMWAQKAPPQKAKKRTPRPVRTFEIKFDRRVKETGNVYFEHETLENSRADFIVYKLDSDGKFYIQETPKVLVLIKLPQFKSVNGGDKWGPGTLITEEVFKQHFEDTEKTFATETIS